MDTDSLGFFSTSSATFCTDCAWTCPCTRAMSIILAVLLGTLLMSSRVAARQQWQPACHHSQSR